jgi:myosin-7
MIPQSLLQEASRYSLAEYYGNKLADRRRFFKKLTHDQIMKWSPDLISKPLIRLPDMLYDNAIQLFKNLFSYMGDRKSSKKPILHAKKHLKLTLNAPEDLKDEAYIQVLKQIKDHKDYDKGIRGWNFFAILASCYAPSMELFYAIISYLVNEIRSNIDQNIVKRCNYIAVRLCRSFDQKRRVIPSDEELIHIEGMKPIMFPAYFFSETHTLVPTESYTTVRELKTTIMRKLQLNISRIPYYALYEVCNKQDCIEERFLDDFDRIVDITAVWAKETEDYQKRNESIEFKIYVKIQLYYQYSEEDIDTITMHFVQTNYDVNKGKFNLTESDIITLASIQLYANWGNLSHEEAFKYLEKNIEKYIPLNKFKNYPPTYWSKSIMDFYTTLKLTSKIEAKLTYLEHLKHNCLWESHQFSVKVYLTHNY